METILPTSYPCLFTSAYLSRASDIQAGAEAANGLALVRVTMHAMLAWAFWETLGKGLYTAGRYAGLINYYIKASHSPAVWKAIMGLMANHATLVAPCERSAKYP